MRLARLGLIPLIVLHTFCRAQVPEYLDQDLLSIVDSSNWTVSFSNYITVDELPDGESLELVTVSNRLCGTGFVNSTGQVNRPLLQDISELVFFNTSTNYYVDVTKAAASQAAAAYHVLATGSLVKQASYAWHSGSQRFLKHLLYCGTGAVIQASVQMNTLNLSAYDCVDLQMTLSVFRSAALVDLGATTSLFNQYTEDYLRTEGWPVVYSSVTCLPCPAEPAFPKVCKALTLTHMLCHAVKTYYHRRDGRTSSGPVPQKDAYCSKRFLQLHIAGESSVASC